MYKIFKDNYCNVWFGEYLDEMEAILNTPASIIRRYSILSISDRYILKRIKPQRFNQYINKFFKSQAKREYISTKILSSIGIKTPHIYTYSISLNIFCKYESMILLQKVDNIGTMADIFKQQIDETTKLKLLGNFKRDLKIMLKNNIYHKDMHFNNILVTSNYNLVWIDNDIAYIKSFNDRYRSISKILKSRFLSDEEKETIKQIVLK